MLKSFRCEESATTCESSREAKREDALATLHQSRGKRVLAPEDLLLYNLDADPGETRNVTTAAYPEVVAVLTRLKLAHEAEPDIFGAPAANLSPIAKLLST